MALIKCKECGKDVSDSAKTCPNCGIKILQTPAEDALKDSLLWGIKWFSILFTICFFIVVAVLLYFVITI